MHKKIAISRVFVCVLLLLLTASLVVSFVAPSLAYFQTIFTSTGYNSAKVELIFDRLDFTKFTAQQLTEFGLDEDAEWGTKANPYVISEKYHVQNLSVLQNNGFFKERKDTSNNPLQSFFRVCNTDGTPVAINCEGMTMAPVGTHANPFTGVIDGALISGEATYKYTPRSSSDTVAEKSYGVSVSTIGNLIVKASTSEPDIGFFGCVGYHGTVTVDETGANPPQISNGYAASVQNLLLADVTVSSVPTLKDSLAAWWAQVKATIQVEEAPEHRHEDFESHHIGVVAGHAEFATINNVSVFYTQGVQTFQISGSSYINYYSTTGLIGMLHYVNPTITSGGVLVGDGNSVSDGDMVEGGLGGGGTISGTLTGYMMAENLFVEHENSLKAQGKQPDSDGIYDVKEMVMRNPKYKEGSTNAEEKDQYKPLFETVTMQEKANLLGDWTPVDYYIFRDSVFTFALSASSKDSENYATKTDYVQKLWVESTNINIASNYNDLTLKDDPNGTDYVAYKLSSVTSLTDGGYYVLTYHDKGNPDNLADTSDDKLYIFPITDSVSTGSCTILTPQDFYQENGVTVKFDNNGNLTEFYITDHSLIYYSDAFLYDTANKKTISAPQNDKSALAIETTYSWWTFTPDPPAPILSDLNPVDDLGFWTTDGQLRSFDWKFVSQTQSDGSLKYAIYLDYYFVGGGSTTTRGCSTLHFDSDRERITFISSDRSTEEGTDFIPYYDFTIFSVSKNTSTSSVSGGNISVPAQNFLPSTSSTTFDPSQYVFEDKGNGNYKLSPLANYNLNSGKGTKVTELNHAVKLYKATSYNSQLTLSNTALGNWFGDIFDTNTGGVVISKIGTTDINYTIPAGMIAFYIDEEVTNAQKPSYINIIVAVNPNQTTNGRIGLWNTGVKKDTTQWNTTFDINNPTYYFDLPVSKAATSQNDKQYTITVSEYYKPDAEQMKDAQGNLMFDDKGRPIYTPEQGNRYVYLGGQAALVYHSFEVTEGGIYLLGSGVGPMTVAYFSVSGAAGQGADGTSTSPLGDIDFVYENNGDIITIDKKFNGVQDPTNEDYSYYYPSYHFVVMKRDGTDSDHPSVQTENIWVYRYIDPNDTTSPKRYISITGCDDAENKGLTDLYQDSPPPD